MKNNFFIKTVAALLAVITMGVLCSGCGHSEKNSNDGASPQNAPDEISSYTAQPITAGCDGCAITDGVALWDLDGDGTMEKVCLKIEKSQTLSWSQDTHLTLYINDTAFELGSYFSIAHYDENSQYIFDGVPDGLFYIADINNTDNFTELAVCIPQGFTDSGTHFFRYQNGSLSETSYIMGTVNSSSFALDGTITCETPLISIVDWYGNVNYTMDNSGAFTMQGGYCDGYVDASLSADRNRELLKVIIKSDVLFVYTEPDETLRAKVLEPCDLYLLGTDNKFWVKCQTADGTVYWFKCSENTEGGDVVLNDMGTVPEEIFDGLYRRNSN